MSDLLYGIKIWAEVSFVLSQFTCLTDGWTNKTFFSWLIACSVVKMFSSREIMGSFGHSQVNVHCFIIARLVIGLLA